MIKLAQKNPTQALQAARRVSIPWYRAQALAWVARYTTSKTSERALKESRTAAAGAADLYQQTAALAWPLRAALENSQIRQANDVLSDAGRLLPNVEPIASRAEAALLLFEASVIAGPDFQKPLIECILKCCPSEGNWRAARLHKVLQERSGIGTRPFFHCRPKA